MMSFLHLSPNCAFVQVKILSRDILEQFLHSQIFTGEKSDSQTYQVLQS